MDSRSTCTSVTRTVATTEGFSNAHEWYVPRDMHLKYCEEMAEEIIMTSRILLSVHSRVRFVSSANCTLEKLQSVAKTETNETQNDS